MSPLLPLWGLVFARAAGLLALAPPTGWRHFPPTLRVAVAAVLAVPVALAAGVPAATLSLPAYVAALLREAAIGLLMGVGLWLIMGAAIAAGHLQDWVGGFGSGEEDEGPLARLFGVIAVAFFVQLNGLHWLIAFLRQSLAALPAGHALPATDAVVLWPAQFFGALLQLAAPAVLAVLLAALLIATIQRTLPALRAAEFLPAARALVTLLALIALAPLLGMVLLQQVNNVAQLATRWLAGA